MLNSLELREWLNKLVQLAELMAQGSAYSEEDHFAFMAICFLNKQIDHARSILPLIPRRDAMLIARSLMEGIAQLLWAAKNPEVLPLRWRTFAWVHDWRLLQEMSALGDIIDEQRRSDIEDALCKHCDQFLTPKGQKARDKGTSRGTRFCTTSKK